MCNRVDNYGLSISEVSAELHALNVQENCYYAEEIYAFQRPSIPVVLEYNGRKITHIWGINQEISNDKPAKRINLTAEKSHTF